MKHLLALAVFALGIPASATAQDYPTKPIRFIVGYSPGGGIDTQARFVAAGLSKELGQPVIVENRPGAGGTIAATYVTKAEPDGYTLCFCETAILMGPTIYNTASYNPLKDFVPVAKTGEAYLALMASKNSGLKTLDDLLSYPADGQPLFYASSGTATVHHISGEILRELTGLPLEHVPYRGGAPAVQAVASGQTALGFASLTSAQALADAGNVTLLATTNDKRVEAYPDLVSIGEKYPGYSGTVQQYVLAPVGTPDAIVTKLSKALAVATADQTFKDSLIKVGMASAYLSSEDLKSALPGIAQQWITAARKIKAAN